MEVTGCSLGSANLTGAGRALSSQALGFLPRRQRASIRTYAKGKKKPEYGTGRARLPGLADMLKEMEGGGAGSSGSGGSPSKSSSAAAAPPARPVRPAGSAGGGGSSTVAGEEPSLGDYLKFGRLMGEKPNQVAQQLELGGVRVRLDEESVDYMQEWEQEELQAYRMFEAVVNAGASGRAPGAQASAAARKLERNKQRVLSTPSPTQMLDSMRRELGAGVQLTAAQRKLARSKGAGGGMRASLEALMEGAQLEGDADDAFEMVARPRRPGAPMAAPARLAGKPSRPGDYQDGEDASDDAMEGEEDEYAAWAAAQDATYSQFDSLLSSSPAPAASARAAKKPAGRPASSARVMLNLRDVPRGPIKLSARPQASAAQREAAQRPAPPQLAPPPRLAPPPTLSAKPARPQAAPLPAPAAAPETPAPLPMPELASKPKAAAAAAPQQAAAAPAAAKPPPKRKPRPSVEAAEPAAAPTQPVEPLAAKPSRPAARQQAEEQKEEAVVEQQAAEPTLSQPEQQQQQQQQQQQAHLMDEPSPPAPAPPAAVAPPELQRPAAAKPAAPAPPQRPRVSSEEARAARHAANAKRGHDALLERSVQTLEVFKVNAAGVLVRSAGLSGFIPTSLLSSAHVAAVVEREAPLLAAAAAGAIVRDLEASAQPAAAADGTDVTALMRAAVRRQALAEVMMGQLVKAVVVNVDGESGRVVMSERAVGGAREEHSARAAPPSLEELGAAARMLGEVVDATIVNVKPFGAFVEFGVPMPGGHTARLVGLVHASEVSWDPAAEDALAQLQTGQPVRAKVVHVDASEGKRRIFLSLRRTAPNPLLETLDSLVTASAAARSASLASGSSDGGGGGASSDGQLDQRPALGDLPDALRFCELLIAGGRGSVVSAAPGVRLQSRAAAQETEVYMAKDASAGIGAAVTAAGGAPAAAPAAPTVPEGCQAFNFVLRKGQAVQEVAVVASCARDELRSLVAAAVAQLVSETA